jgi:hypothetical protein
MANYNPNTSGLRPPWKKGQCGNPNPKGRPPSRVPEALNVILGRKKSKSFYQLNITEIVGWEATVLTMTAEELKSLAKWDEANAYAKGLALSILFDMKNGSTKTIDKLRDRLFGKTIQKFELTGADGRPFNPEPVVIEVIDSREKVSKNAENSDDENI